MDFKNIPLGRPGFNPQHHIILRPPPGVVPKYRAGSKPPARLGMTPKVNKQ